jgi:anti-sigma B factor antagonist
MKLKAREVEGIIVLEVKGQMIGGPEAAVLPETIKAEIDKGKKRFVLDLGEVDRMNSTGLGNLIGSLTTIKNAGGELKLANVAEKIQSLLLITKLVTIFESHDTVDKAVRSF